MRSIRYDYNTVIQTLKKNIRYLVMESPNISLKDLFNYEEGGTMDRSVIYRFIKDNKDVPQTDEISKERFNSISLKTLCHISTFLDISIDELLTTDLSTIVTMGDPIADSISLTDIENRFFLPPAISRKGEEEDPLVNIIYKQTKSMYSQIKKAINHGINTNLIGYETINLDEPAVTDQYIAFKTLISSLNTTSNKVVPIHFLTIYSRIAIRNKGKNTDNISTRAYLRLAFNIPIDEFIKSKGSLSYTEKLSVLKNLDGAHRKMGLNSESEIISTSTESMQDLSNLKLSFSTVLKDGKLLYKQSRQIITDTLIAEISNMAFEYQFRKKIESSLVDDQNYKFKYII